MYFFKELFWQHSCQFYSVKTYNVLLLLLQCMQDVILLWGKKINQETHMNVVSKFLKIKRKTNEAGTQRKLHEHNNSFKHY